MESWSRNWLGNVGLDYGTVESAQIVLGYRSDAAMEVATFNLDLMLLMDGWWCGLG
jgi:hypothetical protein